MVSIDFRVDLRVIGATSGKNLYGMPQINHPVIWLRTKVSDKPGKESTITAIFIGRVLEILLYPYCR
jgi:hypothetical protein